MDHKPSTKRNLELVSGSPQVLKPDCGIGRRVQHDVKIPILFVVLCLAITACGGFKDDEMRLSSWVSSPQETDLFESTLATFREQNPEITFDFEPIPGNYSEKLQLMLGTNTAPDVFFLKGMLSPSYMSFGILKDLNPNIEADPNFNRDDFFPSLLEAFEKDGGQYGIPKDFSPYVLFYNKQMFAEAGIDSIPKNWDELVEVATTLTKDLDGDGTKDQYGLVLEPILEMIMPFVYQNGGYFQNPDGSLGVTDEPFLEAVEFYHGLYSSGIATIPTDVGQGWNGDTFGRGKAAMALSGNWLLPFLEVNYPDLEWAIAPLPAGKQKATIAFTTAYAMPKKVKHEEDAWKLVSYLGGKEGMKQWTSQGLALPARRSVAEENGFYDHPVFGVMMEAVAYAKPFQVRFSERGFEEAAVGVQAMFFTEKSPRQSMIDIAKRIEKYKLDK